MLKKHPWSKLWFASLVSFMFTETHTLDAVQICTHLSSSESLKHQIHWHYNCYMFQKIHHQFP